MASNPLSAEALKLIESYKQALDSERNYNDKDAEKITVHQVSSKLAFFYEKLRNTVDYKEEHLLRKNGIKRILKRRIVTEKNEADVAKFLVFELVRAGYLPNKVIPESRLKDVELIINKYTYLLNHIPNPEGEGDYYNDFLFDWIVGIASCEIEEKLVPHGRENALTNFARELIEKKTEVQEGLVIKPERKKELIYVAVLKNIAKADMDMMRYRIFIMRHPDWIIAPSEDTISKMGLAIRTVIRDIDRIINHRYVENFSRAVKKNLAYFTILQEVMFKSPKDLDYAFSHHYRLEDAIKETCVKKYREAQTKLHRSAMRSIAYIFITKVVLALIIELPFDKYVIGHINYFALGVNILFPPMLMAIVVLNINVPSKKNTELIVKGIKDMIYGDYGKPYVIKRAASPDSLFLKVFRFFYLVIFSISFGAIIIILRNLGFNGVSIALFLFFLSVVSYFGIRIRHNARELLVVQKREGIVNFVKDLFMMPIIQVGQWLSVKLSNVNVFVYVLDFIIEAPFKTFVEIFEKWIYYIKEEQDKIE